MKLKLIILSGIFILGLIFRTVNLESNPANLTTAELELGMSLQGIVKYNAGLLRLPFAIAYSLTIPLTVFLVWKSGGKSRSLISDSGLWTGLFLAVSPWHILLSRRAEFPWNFWEQISVRGLMERFLTYLSPEYLFLTGDKVFLLNGNGGLLLSACLLFIILSLIMATKLDNLFRFCLAVILVGSFAASFQPHTVNAKPLMVALLGWTMLSGWAIAKVWEISLGLKSQLIKILTAGMFMVLIYQVLTSIQNIFIHSQRLSQGQWELVFRSAADYLVDHQNNYDLIVITDKYQYPIRYLRWYSKGKIDENKIIVDKFRDTYVRPKMLYLGPVDELGYYSVKFKIMAEFGLPNGIKRVLFAGVI